MTGHSGSADLTGMLRRQKGFKANPATFPCLMALISEQAPFAEKRELLLASTSPPRSSEEESLAEAWLFSPLSN